jgi:thiol-disulfide isomerase/thioredoxin
LRRGGRFPAASATFTFRIMLSTRTAQSLFPRRFFSHCQIFQFLALAFLLSVACSQPPAGNVATNPLTGVWRGTVHNNSGEEVAFTLELKQDGGQITGALVNGDERLVSTSGTYAKRVLRLRYDFLDAELLATAYGDELQGVFSRQWGKKTLKRDLRAQRAKKQPEATTNTAVSAPSAIDGDWIMRVGEGEKQRLWRAAFKQQGAEVRGTIMPVSGDWGQMTGTFENNQLKLNRFDGINCRIFRATLTPQGALEGIVDLGLFDPVRKVVAERLTAKNKALAASLPDPHTYTRMKNPTEPFKFSFPDLDGKTVSFNDERFKNKVVVITITGSWCPNCHDEAPLLQEFYERYKEQGLEVVALAFEYTGEAARDTEQARIFAQRHGVKYLTLYAGATDSAQEKLAQLENFGAYPTTIFIGRDGLVKRIHAGFEGKATGERHNKLKAELEELLKDLLAERES